MILQVTFERKYWKYKITIDSCISTDIYRDSRRRLYKGLYCLIGLRPPLQHPIEKYCDQASSLWGNNVSAWSHKKRPNLASVRVTKFIIMSNITTFVIKTAYIFPFKENVNNSLHL